MIEKEKAFFTGLCTSKGRKYNKGWTTYVPIPCEFETEGFGKKAYNAFQDTFCGFKACLVERFNYYFGMLLCNAKGNVFRMYRKHHLDFINFIN